ncbi:hypothetical protein HK102_008390, partial [Quaeritorhiza haematococci]
ISMTSDGEAGLKDEMQIDPETIEDHIQVDMTELVKKDRDEPPLTKKKTKELVVIGQASENASSSESGEKVEPQGSHPVVVGSRSTPVDSAPGPTTVVKPDDEKATIGEGTTGQGSTQLASQVPPLKPHGAAAKSTLNPRSLPWYPSSEYEQFAQQKPIEGHLKNAGRKSHGCIRGGSYEVGALNGGLGGDGGIMKAKADGGVRFGRGREPSSDRKAGRTLQKPDPKDVTKEISHTKTHLHEPLWNDRTEPHGQGLWYQKSRFQEPIRNDHGTGYRSDRRTHGQEPPRNGNAAQAPQQKPQGFPSGVPERETGHRKTGHVHADRFRKTTESPGPVTTGSSPADTNRKRWESIPQRRLDNFRSSSTWSTGTTSYPQRTFDNKTDLVGKGTSSDHSWKRTAGGPPPSNLNPAAGRSTTTNFQQDTSSLLRKRDPRNSESVERPHIFPARGNEQRKPPHPPPVYPSSSSSSSSRPEFTPRVPIVVSHPVRESSRNVEAERGTDAAMWVGNLPNQVSCGALLKHFGLLDVE